MLVTQQVRSMRCPNPFMSVLLLTSTYGNASSFVDMPDRCHFLKVQIHISLHIAALP